MHSGDCRSGSGGSRWCLVVMTCLLASLLAMSGAGAAENAASSDDLAPGAAEATADPDSEEPTGGVEIVRYAALDRYAMSIEMAQALVDAGNGSSESVVLASGESWADAAMAGPLAAALGAPVVLVPPGGLQSTAARPDLLEFLRSAGVRRVVIVGDPDTLPNHEPSVLFGLGMLPRNIERVQGDNSVEAAIAIAERIGTPADFGSLGGTVIIASDHSVADAVAVGPLAAAGPFPLLLTAPDALDPHIAAYLADQEVAHVVLVGGTTAITPTVQESLEAAEITVTRVAGRDRSDTARLAADLFDQHASGDPVCAAGPTRIGLAPAQHPKQALTAGPLLAQRCAPLRYTGPDRLPADLRNTLYLASHRSESSEAFLFGGEESIPQSSLLVTRPPAKFAAFRIASNLDTGALETELVIVSEDGQRRTYTNTREVLPTTAKRLSTVRAAPRRFLPEVRRLSWSPDGTRLAFFGAQGDSLYVLDTEDEELRQVEFADYELRLLSIQPQWSPDSSKLAFSATIDDDQTLEAEWARRWQDASEFTSELFIYDADSGHTVRATMNARVDLVGTWSPDGTKVLHFGNSSTGYCIRPNLFLHLWVYDLELANSRLVRRSVQCFRDVDSGVYRAVWSPDSVHVAFAASATNADGWYWHELFVADTASSDVAQLSPENCPLCDEARNPVSDPVLWVRGWSPNGDRLAYTTFGSENLHDFPRGLASALPPFGTDIEGPLLDLLGWSPDGESPLYLQDNCRPPVDGYRHLRITSPSPDNTGWDIVLDLPVPLVDWQYVCPISAAQSPDRRHIAFSYQASEIDIAKLSGHQTTPLAPRETGAQDFASSVSGTCVFGGVDAPTLFWGKFGVFGSCTYLLSADD